MKKDRLATSSLTEVSVDIKTAGAMSVKESLESIEKVILANVANTFRMSRILCVLE